MSFSTQGEIALKHRRTRGRSKKMKPGKGGCCIARPRFFLCKQARAVQQEAIRVIWSLGWEAHSMREKSDRPEVAVLRELVHFFEREAWHVQMPVRSVFRLADVLQKARLILAAESERAKRCR